MSGRAGLGLAQGFMQGYDFMDRIDKRERRMGLAEASNNRAEETQGWQRERAGAWREDRQREDDQRLVQAMNQGVQNGKIDPKIAKQFGERFDVDWTNYVDPEFGNSLGVLEGTVKGEYSMKSPEFQRAFERVFRKEIQKGTGEEYQGSDGAHRLEQKRLNRVYPGPDGKSLMVDLDVLDRGPNGEEWRKAPVTKNRSATDDEVRAIPLEAALRKLKGHQLMYESVQASPELQNVIQQYAARTGAELPKPKKSDQYGRPFQHPDLGWVQPGPDGKLHQMDEPGSSGGKAPSDVQTAEWMVANGIAGNLDEAYTRVQESRSDPSRFVASYVDQELKAQEMAGVFPGDPNYLTTEQMREKAIGVLQEIRAQTRGTDSRKQQPPAGLELVSSETELLPEDGSAVPQEDGSYRGKIDRTPEKSNAGAKTAPPGAIKLLNENPDLAGQFKDKYGYLPEGF